MLPFNETKKRKRPERLNMRQKQWLCEQKKSEPTITEKNFVIDPNFQTLLIRNDTVFILSTLNA